MFEFIRIDENSRIPKYRQIVDSIVENISKGNFKIDDKIPSINSFSEEFCLSRDTVEKAYNILKKRKVIVSIRGKGNYIARTKLLSKTNILFLVNKLSNYKLKTYNHFIKNIGSNSHTDLQIYHCDETLFLNLLEKNSQAYDYYIIMPHFKTNDLKHKSFTDNVLKAINNIPKNKLIILDNIKPELDNNLVEIYQDFENDIFTSLNKGIEKIIKYKKLILIFPENNFYPYPRRILHGFKKFCAKHSLDFEILSEVYTDMVLKNGDLFITIAEDDLVSLVKQIRENGLKLGKDIGVISYNDTPLKELLGITVVSTDFKAMGETTAKMILNKEKGRIKNPFNFIERNSV